jgi:exonuclease III
MITDDPENETFNGIRMYKATYAKSLIVSYLNINGLLSKFNEFSEIMEDGLVDIMTVAETKLDETVMDNIILSKNYKIYRRDGTRTSHGLATYVRSDLTHCRRNDLEDGMTCLSEYIIIEVWLKKQRWFIVSV